MRQAPVAVVSVLLAVIPLAACGGDDGGDDTATVTTEAATPTTVEPTTATTAATTSTAPPSTLPPPTPRASAQEAVDYLLGAWRAGDRVGALTVALPEAVDPLFAIAPEAPESRGCNEPPAGFGAPTYCVYRLAAGELQLRAAPVEGGFIVDFAILSAA